MPNQISFEQWCESASEISPFFRHLRKSFLGFLLDSLLTINEVCILMLAVMSSHLRSGGRGDSGRAGGRGMFVMMVVIQQMAVLL